MDIPVTNAALGRVGSKAAIPALTALIHHPKEDVKASAIRALESLGEVADPDTSRCALGPILGREVVRDGRARDTRRRRAIDAVCERVRAGLGRERKTNVAGMTEVMYGLSYLARWRSTHPAADETIRWVREKALGRLHRDERAWFDVTFDG